MRKGKVQPVLRTATAGLVLAVLLGTPMPGYPLEEFHAYLLPETSWVAPGGTVPIRFEVDATAHHFNGYEVTIRFDPSVLVCDSVAEGALMVSLCPNRFKYLTRTDSTVTFAHVLLCGGVYADGPGELSRYYFRALARGTSAVEIVSDPNCTFYDGGYCVNPSVPGGERQVIFHDATVVCFDPQTEVVGPDPATASRPELRFRPNPALQGGDILFSAPQEGPVELDILSPGGRRVFAASWGILERGPQLLPWSGCDDAGRPLPAGVYFVRVRTRAGAAVAKAVLLR